MSKIAENLDSFFFPLKNIRQNGSVYRNHNGVFKPWGPLSVYRVCGKSFFCLRRLAGQGESDSGCGRATVGSFSASRHLV